MVLPIFVPNMPQKKSRNGAMNSIVLPILQKRDNVIRLELLPALSNCLVLKVDRQLYSLSLHHGGLGIPILSEIVESQFEALQAIILPLVTTMIKQDNILPKKSEVNEIKLIITNKQEIHISEQALNWNKVKLLIT